MSKCTTDAGEDTTGEGAILDDALGLIARLQEALQLRGLQAERRLQEATQGQEKEAEHRDQYSLQQQGQEAEGSLREAGQQQEQHAERGLQGTARRQEPVAARRFRDAVRQREETGKGVTRPQQELAQEVTGPEGQGTVRRQEQGVECSPEEAVRHQGEVAHRFQKAKGREGQQTRRAIQGTVRRQAQGIERWLQEAVRRREEAGRRRLEAVRRRRQEVERSLLELMEREELDGESWLLEAQRLQQQRDAVTLSEAITLITKLEDDVNAFRVWNQRSEVDAERLPSLEANVEDLLGGVRRLDDRLRGLEYLQRTVMELFPQVDDLLSRLEEISSSGTASTSSSSSSGNNSAVTSPGGAAAGGGEENPRPSAPRASSTSSSATASALGASVPEGAAGDRRGEAGAGQGAEDVSEWL